MRFKEDISDDRFALSVAELGRWDGHPIAAKFVMDYVPSQLTDDRLAVALTLLFGNQFGGSVEFPRPINMVTASAIRRFVDVPSVFVQGVIDAPAVVDKGHNEGLLQFTNEPSLLNRGPFVRSVDRSEYSGTLLAQHGLITSSNAKIFEQLIGWPAADLAIACLVASDLDIQSYRLTDELLTSKLKACLSDLFKSVGINLLID